MRKPRCMKSQGLEGLSQLFIAAFVIVAKPFNVVIDSCNQEKVYGRSKWYRAENRAGAEVKEWAELKKKSRDQRTFSLRTPLSFLCPGLDSLPASAAKGFSLRMPAGREPAHPRSATYYIGILSLGDLLFRKESGAEVKEKAGNTAHRSVSPLLFLCPGLGYYMIKDTLVLPKSPVPLSRSWSFYLSAPSNWVWSAAK